MEPVTQALLGAAFGSAAAGHKLGRKAAFYGAVGGIIPDLDVFWPTGEFWESWIVHRGSTHSLWFGPVIGSMLGLFVWAIYHRKYQRAGFLQSTRRALGRRESGFWLALLLLGVAAATLWAPRLGEWAVVVIIVISAFILAIWIGRADASEGKLHHPGAPEARKWWIWVFVLSMLTHPLLDTCTTYGTQLFAPLWRRRFAWDSVGIIDPFYTLPLALMLFAGLIARPRLGGGAARFFAVIGIIVSTGYLIWGWHLTRQAEQAARAQLARHSAIPMDEIRVDAYPTLFQPWLKRVVVTPKPEARNFRAVLVGYTSLWTDSPGPIPFERSELPESALARKLITETEGGRTFAWFADQRLAWHEEPVALDGRGQQRAPQAAVEQPVTKAGIGLASAGEGLAAPATEVEASAEAQATNPASVRMGTRVNVDDVRYGYPGRPPGHGLWGITAVFDAEGNLVGEVERLRRPRPDNIKASIIQLWTLATGGPVQALN